MGRSVILDASWSCAEHRVAAAALAERSSSDLDQLRCVLPDGAADERIRSRRSGSDADVHIAAEISARFDDWSEAAAVDTSLPPGEAVTRILRHLQPWRTVERRPHPYMLPD
jgi:predicted kinase